jgi:hypothetical protein
LSHRDGKPQKTQNLGVRLGWVKLKNPKNPEPKNPAVPSLAKYSRLQQTTSNLCEKRILALAILAPTLLY